MEIEDIFKNLEKKEEQKLKMKCKEKEKIVIENDKIIQEVEEKCPLCKSKMKMITQPHKTYDYIETRIIFFCSHCNLHKGIVHSNIRKGRSLH